MSAPDADGGACLGQYFADYEVYDGGHCIAWGQVAARLNDGAKASADAIVATLRDDAARQHGVARGAIRLRCVCRL
ncbi:hypothetical protein [Pseudoxanthomonas sp. Root630]|uniref:hypothetical protein n=1 Tax=Pseudoxanthomonas sp. Root630 TaxID=1736574 RepID=UPI0007035F20|nr:hypothetical protein [Pseudoxanthomonas sp. Root630]KRA41860.1 hypothetical protein ASD72_14835 [Pseudoxanthomonas sp. Root630]